MKHSKSFIKSIKSTVLILLVIAMPAFGMEIIQASESILKPIFERLHADIQAKKIIPDALSAELKNFYLDAMVNEMGDPSIEKDYKTHLSALRLRLKWTDEYIKDSVTITELSIKFLDFLRDLTKEDFAITKGKPVSLDNFEPVTDVFIKKTTFRLTAQKLSNKPGALENFDKKFNKRKEELFNEAYPSAKPKTVIKEVSAENISTISTDQENLKKALGKAISEQENGGEIQPATFHTFANKIMELDKQIATEKIMVSHNMEANQETLKELMAKLQTHEINKIFKSAAFLLGTKLAQPMMSLPGFSTTSEEIMDIVNEQTNAILSAFKEIICAGYPKQGNQDQPFQWSRQYMQANSNLPVVKEINKNLSAIVNSYFPIETYLQDTLIDHGNANKTYEFGKQITQLFS